MLSPSERDALWQNLTAIFPSVPEKLAFETGTARGPVMRHGTALLACVFTPDGERIVVAGGGRLPGVDSSIRVFDRATGDELLICRGHICGVYKLAVDPHTGFLASASEDYSVVLWNLDRQDAIFLAGGDPIVKGYVSFAAKKRWLAIGEIEAYEDFKNSVAVIDLASGRRIFQQKLPNNKQVAGLALSNDGENLFVATANHQHSPAGIELSRWNLSQTQSESWLAKGFRSILPFSPGGTRVWQSTQRDLDINALHILPAGDRIVAAIMQHDDYASGVALLDAYSGEVLAKRVQPTIGSSIAVSPDGRFLAVAVGDWGVELLHAADLTPVKLLLGKADGSSFTSVCFSPDGKTIAVGVTLQTDKGPRGELKIIDVEDR